MLETESRWTIAEQVVCERWGVPFSMELKRRLLGTHIQLSGQILADWVGAGRDRGPDLAREFIEAYREAVDEHGVDAMPGAVELVAALAERVPVAVASNTHIDDTLRVLARSPLPEVFQAVVCAGDGIPPKPAPDVYLAACAALGVAPNMAAAFEDSPVGAAAAMAGGLRVYGVPSTPGVTVTAHVTLTSLREITAHELLG